MTQITYLRGKALNYNNIIMWKLRGGKTYNETLC